MPVFFWLAYFKPTLSIRQISSGNTARNSTPTSELVLLAYYITAINIEEAFHARHVGVGSPNPAGSPKPAGESPIPHEPFKGIVLTDTFNLNKRNKGGQPFSRKSGSRTTARSRSSSAIHPGRQGNNVQRTTTPNVDYPELKQRIRDTYTEYSTATLKRSLFDTYKLAIRWASDRIKEQGDVAFVTNGSWIDGNADTGIRACLAEEFGSIYVLHLRGESTDSGRTVTSRGRQGVGFPNPSGVGSTPQR